MTESERSLAGLNVLIVEDEALVALNLETMLEDLGCQVVGPVMRLDRLDDMISAPLRADAAILDVNIGGKEIFPLAQRLAALGVPLVFATGYGRAGLPEAWHGWPILQKPYSLEEIVRGLMQAMETRPIPSVEGCPRAGQSAILDEA